MTDKPVEDDVRHDDLERLRECLSYDATTGILRWKKRLATSIAVGDEAGCLDCRGYRFIRLDRRLHLAHRISWALHHGAWPISDLDHINLDRGDNRIANLRLATRSQNSANTRSRKRLPKGCYQLKGRQRWYSQIKAGSQIIRLGTFATAEEAATAFRLAHAQVHGAFSRCEAR